jgi:glutamine cyclotransferase
MRARIAGARAPSLTKKSLLLAVALAGLAAAIVAPPGSAGTQQDSVTWYDYEVVNVYPHDPGAFTQGLLFRDGFLFESTGRQGHSTVRKVRLPTGEVLQERVVDASYFAEGLTDWKDSLVQLTWRAGVGFVYDLETFALRRVFRYPGEGWGLARCGGRLVMSDGTPVLRFLDPETLVETGRVSVAASGKPIGNLNELEVVRGKVFANVWQTDQIVIIDPRNGMVTGRIDLEGLLTPKERNRSAGVLNGIAYDSAGDRLFVTGKLWPRLFEIRLRQR